ncbi:putative 5-oxoprolinase (ATP-hydrolyzing) [Frankia canadensis]|uniref:Putative 5-oxoprolinase (ATP-hydrolyzing) n=1 Tax=Frankia canadensis TaxID=1836972 RepID=A0A2I2KI44_9ACTN|nr:putative 5-oxoprolinase (ATP-hydrolyzing) [Frankia canadensis]SOU52622.1 putative 5-oxoprolinase (ATP-hydrolyzing) [Frankia canadensis]
MRMYGRTLRNGEPMTAAEGPLGHVTPDGQLREDEISAATRAQGPWDGSRLPWVPPVSIQTPSDLLFDAEFDTDIDPVTYQVLRYRLWNVNLAHSDAIKRVSGAPYVCYLDDFSTSIHAENGDTILCGPSMVYFVGLADLGVKWTLQHRAGNPGIHAGDVFLHNDPYIGVTHQNDVAVFAPVFHDGRLFAWVYSGAHQADVGGAEPGSWCPNATDMYQEAQPWPVVKLVDGGEVRGDILGLFVRHSRAGAQVELQLRGQLAGIDAATRRIRELLDEYGPRVVKGAMRRMVADTAAAVARRLETVPDGEIAETWRMGIPGDFARLHRLSRTIRKEGDLLVFGTRGSDPQLPKGVNGTYATFRSGAVVAASMLLAWDQLYCPAGVLNQMRFEPDAGTLSVATHPGAVSTQLFTVAGMHLSRNVLSRLLMTGSDDLRARVRAASVGQGSTIVPSGQGLDGSASYANFWDVLMGSTGASPFDDGEDVAGAWFSPSSGGGNVEEIEASAPMLYLYRRERADSGGPGCFRGGNSIEVAQIAHKARVWMAQPVGNDPSINAVPGLAGGLPGFPGAWEAKTASGILAALADGRLPASRRELESLVGPFERLTSQDYFICGDDMILVLGQTSSGGYGDPLTRNPSFVETDVERGSVTAEAAEASYAVVLVDGRIDQRATADLRARRRRERLAAAAAPVAPRPGHVEPGEVRRRVSGMIDLTDTADGPLWACGDCGRQLAPADENYRRGAALLESSPHAVRPELYPDPEAVFDPSVRFVLRQWCCPSCGVLLSIEPAAEGDPWLNEMPTIRPSAPAEVTA